MNNVQIPCPEGHQGELLALYECYWAYPVGWVIAHMSFSRVKNFTWQVDDDDDDDDWLYIESIFFKYVLLRIMKTENPHSQFFQIIFLSSQPTHKMHIWVKCKRLYLSFKIYISEIIFLPFILFLTITSGVKGIWGRQAPMCNGEIICWANGERVVCSMVGFQLGGLSTYLYILIHSSYPHLYNSIFYMR